MRVIICGAGQVGFSITSYLARENNGVTVIDQSPEMIARVNMDIDANGIVGSASSPEILNKAGASDADMIIAVTQNDEVNICLLYTSPSPRDQRGSRMPSSA